jgi:hypothetical protein
MTQPSFNTFYYYYYLANEDEGSGPSFQDTWISFIQGWFVPSLIELGWLVQEKKIFQSFISFWRRMLTFGLYRLQINPSIQRWFVPSLIKIDPVVLEMKSKTYVKLHRRTKKSSLELRWAIKKYSQNEYCTKIKTAYNYCIMKVFVHFHYIYRPNRLLIDVHFLSSLTKNSCLNHVNIFF